MPLGGNITNLVESIFYPKTKESSQNNDQTEHMRELNKQNNVNISFLPGFLKTFSKE